MSTMCLRAYMHVLVIALATHPSHGTIVLSKCENHNEFIFFSIQLLQLRSSSSSSSSTGLILMTIVLNYSLKTEMTRENGRNSFNFICFDVDFRWLLVKIHPLFSRAQRKDFREFTQISLASFVFFFSILSHFELF